MSRSVAVPTSPYIHPEFGFFCPAPRIRRRLRVALACLAVAGAATVMAAADRHELDAAATRIDEASIVETVPATKNLTPFAAVDPRLTVVEGVHTAADRPPCFIPANLDGNCVSVRLRKPRTVRVATDRPAVAAVPLGRTAIVTTSMINAAIPAVSAGGQGEGGRRHGLFAGLGRRPANDAVRVWREAAQALGLIVRKRGRLVPAAGVEALLLDSRHPDYLAGHLRFGALRSLDYEAMGELFRRGRTLAAGSRPRRNESIEEATNWDHEM